MHASSMRCGRLDLSLEPIGQASQILFVKLCAELKIGPPPRLRNDLIVANASANFVNSV